MDPNLGIQLQDSYVYLAWLRSGGSGESKCGARAGGEEKGRGVVARQVRGEKVFDCSLKKS